MNISGVIVDILNILMKIIFYTSFNIVLLFFYDFLLDENSYEIKERLYISIGGALICTMVPSLDYMKKIIEHYLRIRNKCMKAINSIKGVSI